MPLSDTSFLVRSIEFRKFDQVESHKELKITAEVEGELESKDADSVRDDLNRIRRHITENEKMAGVELIDESAVSSKVEFTLASTQLLPKDSKIGDKLDEEGLLNNSLDLAEDIGELSSALKCIQNGEELFTEDFVAYEELYLDLNGDVYCLCEILTEICDPQIVENQKIISLIEELFIPSSDEMSVSIRRPIMRKIERFVDRNINEIS